MPSDNEIINKYISDLCLSCKIWTFLLLMMFPVFTIILFFWSSSFSCEFEMNNTFLVLGIKGFFVLVPDYVMELFLAEFLHDMRFSDSCMNFAWYRIVPCIKLLLCICSCSRKNIIF